jgi:hypothetical protein
MNYREITPRPEIGFYRPRAVGLLRRYLRSALEVGRTPSILKQEYFRTRMPHQYRGFEEAVILVHDVERVLDRISHFHQQLIACVILEENTHDEAAVILGIGRASVTRNLVDALDQLSERFLQLRLISESLDGPRPKKSCQEHEKLHFAATA